MILCLWNFRQQKKKYGFILYIGSVLQVLDGDNFRIKFMSQYNNRHNEFIYPNVDLIENVANENIISVLPRSCCSQGQTYVSL